MKLLRVHIVKAPTCGGLLDGTDVWLRSPAETESEFEPLCLIGPNGSGKSQFLQIVAEIFQSILSETVKSEERSDGNSELQFVVEYYIRNGAEGARTRVRATRIGGGRRKPRLLIEAMVGSEWVEKGLQMAETRALLPTKVIGYTSGNNETLSLPFLVSRGAYADEVGTQALHEVVSPEAVPDTRLLFIDYSTHLEVLVSNLLLGTPGQCAALLREAQLDDLHSFRCVVQLAHSAAPKAPTRKTQRKRKGIQLTSELEGYVDRLRRCSTCYDHDERTDTYTFDYRVDAETRRAFGYFWKSAIELYSALHKLAMLNDLAVGKATRERFKRETKSRRFASRLPDPPDGDKVFRFERVAFNSRARGQIVDYVSLSDGEHQLAQLLGTCAMICSPNVLFLLDEPESHFNPQWRVKFVSRILELPTANGRRRDADANVSHQDFLLTTHAPFVASDSPRSRVFLFNKSIETGKIHVTHPDIETFGATFDAILEACFGVEPPISQMAREEIAGLMASEDPAEIEAGMKGLGHSVDKVFLADRIRELEKAREA